ncbi:hypothetical protein EDC94DRAFT_591383 [Helicostylum pulchrum]|nr:hypothetical protein EDC94DRAFT_591383 [Helicostylum pulchrum]
MCSPRRSKFSPRVPHKPTRRMLSLALILTIFLTLYETSGSLVLLGLSACLSFLKKIYVLLISCFVAEKLAIRLSRPKFL